MTIGRASGQENSPISFSAICLLTIRGRNPRCRICFRPRLVRRATLRGFAGVISGRPTASKTFKLVGQSFGRPITRRFTGTTKPAASGCVMQHDSGTVSGSEKSRIITLTLRLNLSPPAYPGNSYPLIRRVLNYFRSTATISLPPCSIPLSGRRAAAVQKRQRRYP